MNRVLVLTDQARFSRAGFRKPCRLVVSRSVSVSDPAGQCGEAYKSMQPEPGLIGPHWRVHFRDTADTHARMPGCNLVIRVGPCREN